MIDFACKQFHLNDVVKCALGLRKADLKLLLHLLDLEEKWLPTEEIAQKTKLDLSTVQRAVKRLHEKGILLRTQENLDGGGYLFLYKTSERNHIRKVILGIIDGWRSKVSLELQKW